MPFDQPQHPPRLTASQRRDVTRRAKLVADGRMLFSEALNDLMCIDLLRGGEGDLETEERLGDALSDATLARMEGQSSWQERVRRPSAGRSR